MIDTLPTSELLPTNVDCIGQLLQRAEAGDTSTLPALRKLLESPAAVAMCGGDLAQQIEASLIDAAAGKNLALRQGLLRKTRQMRQELAGPSPTPLDQLLVERIVTCWLHLQDVHIRFVQSCELSVHEADYQQRAIDRCQRRYLSAIKTLALVRRAAVPTLQVNIAKKQVNVAGGAG